MLYTNFLRGGPEDTDSFFIELFDKSIVHFKRNMVQFLKKNV